VDDVQTSKHVAVL